MIKANYWKTVLVIVLLVSFVSNLAGAETFRFTASVDNRPVQPENIPRWEWLLDQISANVGDEGVFHIMPGDFDDPQTTDTSLKTQFGSDVVWYPVVGNHEAETADDMTWIREAFSSLPHVVNWGPPGCETTTYSFDYGNAHFVAINEYYNGTSDTGTDGDVVDALYYWLVDDLANNTKPAVFVIGHEPAYPEYAHVGDSLDGHPANRDRFWKLLNDEKVIAYLCGHTHWYYAKQVDGDDWEPFTWQIDCGNAGNPRELEQTFVDVTVTDADVTFNTWQGLENNSYTITDSWTVDIPVVHNPSPADGATDVSPASVALSATVENPSGTEEPVNVEFFGREAPSFSIVVLPDTQYYSQSYPDIFTAQTQWIVDNLASENIIFVTHEGDIVQTWDSTTEWERAETSMSLLNGVVPYGVLPGNHDVPTDYYNVYFPYTRYESESWYGGHYPTTGNDNNYQLFSAGGDDYIILHIEYNPSSDVITWADQVLSDYADRIAIITTHAYLNEDGSRRSDDGGTTVWNDLVLLNDNVRFVLCGHVSAEAMRTDVLDNPEREVHQILACYQGRTNGGNGWLRIMRFVPAEDTVYVDTYSPWLDQYETDADSEFELAFGMTGTGYSSIDSETGVASGATASTTWSDLAMETEYEWYATVTDIVPDPDVTVAGPVWSFTTASLKAGNPSPANGATDVDVDADLSWSTGVDAVSHDVYFGTDAASLPLVSAEQSGTTYEPGTLQQGVTYYWAIDEHYSEGGVVYGDVWSFTTAPLAFQQGVNGYSGMVDTMIRWATANDNYADSATQYYGGYQYQYNADTESSGGPCQILLRFDGIIGPDPGQIPQDSTIVSATLRIRSTDDGHGGKLHRILQPWVDEDVTWNNSFGGDGIQADGTEAVSVENDGVPLNNPDTDVDLDVTATLQDWADGIAVNNGWAILPNGTNGWHMAAAEHPTLDYRPELLVTFTTTVKATNPFPADGAEDVAVNAALSWTADASTESHNVYFGEDAASLPLLSEGQTGTTFDPPGSMGYETTYYWRIDEVGPGGIAEGEVWSFTTVQPPLPGQATNPDPGNGETGVPVDCVLSWNAGVGVEIVSHKVYFGTEYPFPQFPYPVTLDLEVTTYDPLGAEDLEPGITYYWRIDEIDSEMTVYTGNVWSFTTYIEAPESATPSDPVKPDGVGGVTAVDVPDVGVSVILAWFSGDRAASHDVYFGTSVGSLEFKGNILQEVGEYIEPPLDKTRFIWDPAPDYEDLPYESSYWWRIDEINPGGVTEGAVWNFTTESDTYPPQFTYLEADSITSHTATISWTTNELSDSLVDYGLDTSYGSSKFDGTLVKVHSITLTGLEPGTTYYFMATSEDNVGNSASEVGSPFTTETLPWSDGFESSSLAAAGWITSGSVLIKEPAAYEGVYGVQIGGTASIAKSVSTVGFVDIHVNYARKTKGLDSSEFLYVEWFDGAQWNPLEQTKDTAWSVRDIGAAADNNPDFKLRFRTNANKTNEYASVDSVEIIGTPSGPVDNPPVVTISSPSDGATFGSGDEISFLGTAIDAEDGDLTAGMTWQSSIDGPIGETGGSFSTTLLSDGVHLITASATDSAIKTGLASITITVGDPPPSAPTGLVATPDDLQVSLDWDDNGETDLDGYNIYRSETSGSYGAPLAFVTDSAYVDNDVVNGTTYYYVVTAVDQATPTPNESGDSSEVSATPDSFQTVFVESIDMAVVLGKKYYATATITINPGLDGATVVGDWYIKGTLRESGATAVTNASGIAVLTSITTPARSGDTFTFEVTDVILTGYIYSPNDNLETQDSITVP